MGIAAFVAGIAEAAGVGAATAAVVGTVAEGAVIGSAVSGSIAAVTGGDVGDAMLTGALTGGLAGPVGGAIASVAPEAAAVGSITNAVATGAVLGAGSSVAHGGDILTGAALGGIGGGLGQLASNTIGDIMDSAAGANMTPAQDINVNTTSEFTNATNQGILSSPMLTQGTDLGALNAVNEAAQQALANGGVAPSAAGVQLANAPMPTVDIRPMNTDVEALKTGLAANSPAITGTTPVEPLQNAGDVLRGGQAAPNIVTNADGTTVQTFSDGSTLTSDALGNHISTTPPLTETAPTTTAPTTIPTTTTTAPQGGEGGFVDSSGNLYDQFGNPTKNLAGQYVDKSGMVYDEFGNPAGKLNGANNPKVDFSGILNSNGTITRLDGSNTIIDTSGKIIQAPSGVNAGVVGGGAAGATSIPLQQPVQQQGGGESAWKWGEVPQIVQPGLNPGSYARHVAPMYPNAAPGQAQYYWGAHTYAPTEAETNLYNVGTNAPVEPFGAAKSAVGGTDVLDINAYINQMMSAQRQQAAQGSQPQFAGSTGINPLVGTPVNKATPLVQEPVALQPTVLPVAPAVAESAPVAQPVAQPVAP